MVFTMLLALFNQNSLEYYILISHEPKLVWYFTIILAPSNQNSLGYYMLASYEHKLVWYFTIILAPFIQNSLGYYKLEYNANVSEAEESNRLQANFPLTKSGVQNPVQLCYSPSH